MYRKKFLLVLVQCWDTEAGNTQLVATLGIHPFLELAVKSRIPEPPTLSVLLAVWCFLAFAAHGTWAQDSTPAGEDETATEVVEEKESTDLERAEAMLRTLEAELDILTTLQVRSLTVEDEELQLLRIQAGRHIAAIRDVQPDLIELIPELPPDSTRTEAVWSAPLF